MIEQIIDDTTIIGIIIRNSYQQDGIRFFTPQDFSQQLAYMNRPEGYAITPHIHCRVNREVQLTQEVLVIKKGKVQIDFYDNNRHFIKSEIVRAGDVILLASGGHGLIFLEQSEIIEVKQGPYLQDKDKIRFDDKR
jgi:hypothetical protein